MRWLLAKDTRELLASRAYWLLMLLVGLLVGHAFITATETYAELSGAAGGTAVLSQGLNPLDGIVRPTFGAYTLAVTLLLPFVVIRLIADERQSGAMRLLLQARATRAQLVASKLVVLTGAWIAALIPGLVALLMWRLAGGHLHWPEVMSVVTGHVMVALIAIGVGLAAGAIAASSASAAILALTFTLGAWAIDFAATVQGGWIAALARYTPSVVLRTLENGEVRLATIGIALLTAFTGSGIAVIWIAAGKPIVRKAAESGLLIAVAALLGFGISMSRAGYDVSEDRRTSFSPSQERALRSIGKPLTMTVHLGAEDPRRVDLEREILAKLRRTMPVDVHYVAGSRTGLTSPDEHYGEIVYRLGDRADTTRSVIEEVVLELVFRLAGVPQPTEATVEPVYPGYPLRVVPRGALLVFFVGWPLLVIGAWALARRS